MFTALAFFGLMLFSISLLMRNIRIGESIFKWGEIWPSKASLTPTEYWLHRAGLVIAVVGLILTVITLCALPIIYQR